MSGKVLFTDMDYLLGFLTLCFVSGNNLRCGHGRSFSMKEGILTLIQFMMMQNQNPRETQQLHFRKTNKKKIHQLFMRTCFASTKEVNTAWSTVLMALHKEGFCPGIKKLDKVH